MGPSDNDCLRGDRNPAHVSLSVQHRQFHGRLFPLVLQARLLRRLLLPAVRAQAQEREEATAARNGEPTQRGRRRRSTGTGKTSGGADRRGGRPSFRDAAEQRRRATAVCRRLATDGGVLYFRFRVRQHPRDGYHRRRNVGVAVDVAERPARCGRWPRLVASGLRGRRNAPSTSADGLSRRERNRHRKRSCEQRHGSALLWQQVVRKQQTPGRSESRQRSADGSHRQQSRRQHGSEIADLQCQDRTTRSAEDYNQRTRRQQSEKVVTSAEIEVVFTGGRVDKSRSRTSNF